MTLEAPKIETPKVTPVTGDHFEDFLKLGSKSDSQKDKEHDLELAWQVVRNQIKTFHLGHECDLNRILIDLMRLQLLVYPIVEDWKRPLSKSEWKNVEEEFEDFKQQNTYFHYLSLQVKKKDREFYTEVAPLFHLLFRYNQDLQNSWVNFRADWQNYKREWEIFEEHRKTKPSPSSSQEESKASKAQRILLAAPKPPPMFQREYWHALKSATMILEAALHEQCDSYLPPSKKDPEATSSVNAVLTQEMQQIYLRTQGFELLEKVKYVQERNEQLIKDLQRLCGDEPILSEELKHKALSLLNQDSAQESVHTEPEKKSKSRVFLTFLMAGSILLALTVLLFFSLRNQNPQPKKDLKHLVFKPKGETLTLNSPKSDELKTANLEHMMSGFKVNIPVVHSNKRLRKLVETTPPSQKIINDIIREQGPNTSFLFQSANSAYLFWRGKVQEYSSVQSLAKKMKQLEKQYQSMDTVLKNLGKDLLNTVSLIPDRVKNQAVYALEVKNKEGQIVSRVYSEQGKFRMQWNTGKSSGMAIADTPEEIVQRLHQQAKQRREHKFGYE